MIVLAESEGMLKRIIDEIDKVCKRKKLKVSVGESKVTVLEGIVFLRILLFLAIQ